MTQENYPKPGFEGRCETGKRAHPTRADAKRQARSLRLKFGTHTRPYLCHLCGLWHVGHLAPEVMTGRRGALEVYRRRRAS